MIQELRQKYKLDMLLEIAQLPRSTYYYHSNRQNKEDKYAQAKAEIRAIYHENKGRYGYRRVTDELHNRGIMLNHKTVQRLMKELGLICRVRMKKYRSYKGDKGTTADNELNREFRAEKPNQKWVTDVTEFRLFGEKLYLSPILDLYSGDIVTYTLSESPNLLMVTTINEIQIKLHDMDHHKQGYERFVSIIRKLLDMEVLTFPILRELIDRIEVYEAEGTGKNRTQRIAIYYRFVGYLELPAGKINPHYTADLRRGVAIEYIPKQPA